MPALDTPRPDLATKIALDRDHKARRYARALWEAWSPAERAGVGVRAIERAAPKWWRELADSLGEREPSAATRALIISKLREAQARGMV